jgi:EAL domain-containing protein (putative c-di-GMP-specific phosphodiesterase class I)
LYHAKQLGRDNCQFFSEEMNQRVLERLELELELRAALERNEFLLHYQPIIDFTTGTIVCAEALLRWNNPRYGLLSPDTFIPIAEETGLIIPIGEWVLQTACAQNHVWQQLGFDPIPVSVNVSGRQLRQQGVVARFLEILREAGLPPQYLELELTESVADGDPDETVRLFGELKSNGINLSIDDFGTGYSSLSYLKRFPIERLKIDRSFVKDLGTDPDDSAIVKAIVEVAHSLKVKVVAEGVETKEQLEMLRAYGCDAWQGFSYSKPVDAEEFTSFLLQGPAPTDEQFAEALAPRELPAMFGLQPPNVVPAVSRGVIDPRPPGVYRFNGFDPFT